MSQRFLRTLVTTALLLLLRGAYTLFISPLATPLDDRRAAAHSQGEEGSTDGAFDPELADGPQMPQQRRDLLSVAAENLPHAPWTAQARYAVRSSNSYVFAEEWEKAEDSNRVRFEPFALVWRSPESPPDEPPLTIVCDAAVLDFAEKFDIRNPRPGRVVGGSLQGPVIIRGANGLAVNTRNLSFSESSQRAWSDSEIEFAWGPHHGHAQGLELDLVRQLGTPDEDKPAIAGIRALRLVSRVELNLQPGADDPAKPRDRKSSQGVRDEKPGNRASPVKITCDGSFEYKLEVQVAAFNKNVEVAQPTGSNQYDRLKTDTLTLEFVRESGSAKDRDTETDDERQAVASHDGQEAKPKRDALGELKFRWLRANGPGTEIHSDRSNVQATMDEMIYDEPARTVVLKGSNPVRVEQKNHRLQCPEIAVVLGEDSQIEQAHCKGAGRLVRYAGPIPKSEDEPLPRIDFAARWEGELRLDPETGKSGNTIDLQKRVVLTRPGGMRLSAERVRIWIANDDEGEDAGERGGPRRLGDEGRTRPERMLALRQVELKSPQMVGATERLEIWFQPGVLGAPPSAVEGASKRKSGRAEGVQRTVARNATARSVNERVVAVQYEGNDQKSTVDSASGSRVAKSDPALGTTPANGEQERVGERLGKNRGGAPMLVSADVIRVQMLLDGDDAEVERIRTEGHVHVTQSHGAGTVPLDVKGDQLQLWNYTEERQVLRVQGKPAHVHDRGLQLEGDDIRFDRGANLASVQGKGVLRMPVRNGIDGKKLAESQLVDIFWREKMEFDGQTAKFYAGIRTQLEGTELSCEEMQVRLSRRVSFISDSADREPELERVLCRDGVTVKSTEYKENKLQSVRLATGHEFAFEQKTGDMLGDGPGVLTFWTRAAPMAIGGKKGSPAKNTPRGRTAEWTYTRVGFAGKMKGNAEKRRSQFNDRVNVVYGPVASPTDTIDVDKMPLEAGWLKCEELTVTQVLASKGQEEHVTILGKGNAELEGRMKDGYYSALAHTVSFDQSKGMYVLAGDGRRDAELSRESKPGVTNPAVQKAKRFEFLPAKNELNVIDASSAQGGT